MNTMNNKQKILVWDGALLLFALVAKFLAAAMVELLPDCIFATVGLVCPTCGATRCFREFFSGHFALAFQLHPFFCCLIPYMAGAFILLNVGYLLNQHHCQKIGNAMLSEKAITVLVILFAAFGLTRMLLLLP